MYHTNQQDYLKTDIQSIEVGENPLCRCLRIQNVHKCIKKATLKISVELRSSENKKTYSEMPKLLFNRVLSLLKTG